VNVLMDIAEVCDCTNQGFTDSGSIKLVSPNLGILVARDIVAIDQASLDLVNEATNGKFSGLWGPDAGWQTEEAAALGLGSKEYKLLHSE
ncbi:4Fe-4S ferredoxin, partial [Candidatus Woesearchaeota archaeon]|nr:4Fe-4S ferredoxin [Candidatus Woesearchaeota archaeon]